MYHVVSSKLTMPFRFWHHFYVQAATWTGSRIDHHSRTTRISSFRPPVSLALALLLLPLHDARLSSHTAAQCPHLQPLPSQHLCATPLKECLIAHAMLATISLHSAIVLSWRHNVPLRPTYLIGQPCTHPNPTARMRCRCSQLRARHTHPDPLQPQLRPPQACGCQRVRTRAS